MRIKKLTLSAKPLTIAALTLMSTLCVLNAQADTRRDEYPSVVVKYGDLDLSTEAGARHLYKRIVSAAERVCPDNPTLELQFIAQARACRADAISHAVQNINNQQLALIHAQSSRHG